MFTVQIKSWPEQPKTFKTEAEVQAYLDLCSKACWGMCCQGDGNGILEYEVTPPLSYYKESPQFNQGGYYV